MVKGAPFFRSNVVDVKPLELDVTSEEVDDDESQEESLLVLMSPFLNSMRLFGQYFQWPSAGKDKSNGSATSDLNETENKLSTATPETVRKPAWSDRLSLIYAVAVLTLLWLNSIRILTIFTSADNMLPVILNKAMMAIWVFMCTVQQTAYFAASRSGNLDRVLGEFRLKLPECKAYIRRLVTNFVVISWFVALANEAFFIYLTFFSGGYVDILLTPLGTHIPVSNLTPYHALFIVVSIYLNPAWIFPVAMTFLLSLGFAFQFRRLLDRLRRVMTDAGEMGIADDEIEDIRREHQTLCRLMKRADRFLTYHHAAALFGPLVTVIIILYIMMFNRWLLNNSPILFAISGFWLVSGAVQLSLTAAGGIMVNHYVSLTPVSIRRKFIIKPLACSDTHSNTRRCFIVHCTCLGTRR